MAHAPDDETGLERADGRRPRGGDGRLADEAGAPQAAAGGRATRAVIESELADVRGRRDEAEAAYRRHMLWMLLGLSPGALLPALFALSEWGGGAVVVVVVAVCTTESVAALRSKREVRRLERIELGLRSELEEHDAA